MKVLILVAILGAVLGRAAGRAGGSGAGERRLFLSLNRNQKFYRQEDRQRCGLTSPGGDEPDHE